MGSHRSEARRIDPRSAALIALAGVVSLASGCVVGDLEDGRFYASGGQSSGGSKPVGFLPSGGSGFHLVGGSGEEAAGASFGGSASPAGGFVSSAGSPANGGSMASAGSTSETGSTSTGGSASDGGSTSTAGTASDGGTSSTAGTASDGGTSSTAGTASDGGTSSTAGTASDGGTTSPPGSLGGTTSDGPISVAGSTSGEPACEPGSFCRDGDVWACVEGLSFRTVSCAESTRCLLVGNAAKCVPYPCPYGTSGCIDNRIGECAEDGLTLESVSLDCVAADQVCLGPAGCADSVSEQLAPSEFCQSDYSRECHPQSPPDECLHYELPPPATHPVRSNVVDVTSTRRLTSIEADLTGFYSGQRQLRWLIAQDVDGTFVSRYEKQMAREITDDEAFVASGPVDFVLEAGERYLIGVEELELDPPGYSGICGAKAPTIIPPISFGRVVGGDIRSYDSLSLALLRRIPPFAFRLSTELP